MVVPGSREELVALLTAARHSKHLSIRALATRVDVPASTMQGWLDGRHLPTPALRGQFLRMLRLLDITDDAEADRALVAAIEEFATAREPTPSPYLGLRPYSAADSAVYFGRDRTLAELVTAVRDAAATDRAVFVIGASGSGKSSLLGAGLLGQALGPTGPLAGWRGDIVAPAALARFCAERRDAEPDEGTPGDGESRLVVIDQLEDHLADADPAAVFTQIAELPAGVVAVIGLRADAFGIALADERMRPSLATPVLLGPLTRDEFRRIITAPAAERGRPVTQALEELVLRDLYAYGEPSPSLLPLLSSALLGTWAHAAGARPDVEHYLAAGGLWGGLEALAESVLGSLDEGLQTRAKPLLLSLIQVSPDRITRRPIPLDSVPADSSDLVDRLVKARLLTVTGQHLTISHDSLLTHWRRLAGWVDEERDFLLLLRQLQMAATVWADSGRSSRALMPVLGATWTAAAAERADFLTEREQAYLDACRAQTESESREREATIKRLRRRNVLAMTAAVIALAMLVVAGVSYLRTDSFRAEAVVARAAAQSRQLALVSQDAAGKDPNLAAQFSLAGVRVDGTREARSSVLEIAGAPVPLRVLGPPGTTIARATPDGAVFARADGTGQVTVWHDREFRNPVSFQATAGQLFTLAVVRQHERVLAAVGGQQTASLWDITAEPRRLAEFDAVSVAYSTVLTPDAVLFGMLDGSIRAWDISAADAPRPLPGVDLGSPTAVMSLALSSDGRTLAAGGLQGSVSVFQWPSGTPEPPLAMGTGRALSLAYSPDGQELTAGSSTAEVRRWRRDPAGFTELPPLTGFEAYVHAVVDDGQRIITGSSDNTTLVFNRDGTKRATLPGVDIVTSVDVIDGRVLTGSVDGTVRWWPETIEPLLHDTGSVFDLVADDGHWVAASRRGVTPALFRVTPDAVVRVADPVLPAGLEPAILVAIPKAGDILVSATRTGEIVTWPLTDAGAGEPVVSQGVGTWAGLIAISDDGRYLAVTRLRDPGLDIFERDGDRWHLLGEVDGWHHLVSTIPGTSLLATAVESGAVRIWQMAGGPRQLGEFDPQGVPVTLVASPDGKELHIAPPTGQLKVFDITDPARVTQVADLKGPHASVTSVRFSPDGSLLFATATDGRIWVWQRHLPADQADLSIRMPVQARATIALGERLIIGTADGVMTVRPLRVSSAIDQLCAGLGDPLTDVEWTRYAPGVTPVPAC